MDRYLDNEAATEGTYHTDPAGAKWFKTGDLGILPTESDGSYKIMGRLSQDIIKKSGYKISAIEIEGCLLESGLVSEVAVIGIPDETYGEEIVAIVVSKDGGQDQA